MLVTFSNGDGAPVCWSTNCDIGDENEFETLEALENAFTYNVINIFEGQDKGEIIIDLDELDPETLREYREWKNSLERLEHLDRIERLSRIYFKHIFSVGASGKYDFYNLYRIAEDELGKEG